MRAKNPKADIIDDFITAAWQNETGIIDDLAARHPWLTDPANPHLLDALHTACNAAQGDAARHLVMKYHADVNAVQDPARGMTALHEALNSADMATAKMLIENGASVNARVTGKDGFVDGWTPLHFAAADMDADMVSYLIAHGADASATNDEGLDPAALARQNSHPRSQAVAALIDSLSQAKPPFVPPRKQGGAGPAP